MISMRPATAADIGKFYPGHTQSFRAWVADIDGEPEGIVGIALTRPVACMFSTATEKLKPHLGHMAVLRAIKKAESAVKASRVPVIALAEPGLATAPAILQRLGFAHKMTTEDGEVWGTG